MVILVFSCTFHLHFIYIHLHRSIFLDLKSFLDVCIYEKTYSNFYQVPRLLDFTLLSPSISFLLSLTFKNHSSITTVQIVALRLSRYSKKYSMNKVVKLVQLISLIARKKIKFLAETYSLKIASWAAQLLYNHVRG